LHVVEYRIHDMIFSVYFSSLCLGLPLNNFGQVVHTNVLCLSHWAVIW